MAEDEGPIQTNPVAASSSPKLSLTIDDGAGEPRVIECRRVVTLLGSRGGCKITLAHKRVGPVHVALINDGTAIIAIDLVTQHGTLLNGLKMKYEQLSDGDVLTVGPWAFRAGIRAAEPDDLSDSHPFGLEPTPHAFGLEHLDSNRMLQPGRPNCIMGRRRGTDVTISDPRVSRAHSLILNYFGHPALFDLLSPNGTYVNDVPVSFQILKDNDVIRIGDSRFRVRLLDSSVVRRAGENVAKSKASDNGRVGENADAIDIGEVEGSQPWRIVDSLEKANKKR